MREVGRAAIVRASVGVPVTFTLSFMVSEKVTVLPTPRSPLEGDSATDVMVGVVPEDDPEPQPRRFISVISAALAAFTTPGLENAR